MHTHRFDVRHMLREREAVRVFGKELFMHPQLRKHQGVKAFLKVCVCVILCMCGVCVFVRRAPVGG